MRQWASFALFSTISLSAISGLSFAHTASPYVLPEQFDTKTDMLSFQSAITVEKFFVPSSNFKTSYQITSPDGKNATVEAAASLKRFNVAETTLLGDGTYRIRTENAQGNKTKYALIENRWLRVRQPRPQNMPPQAQGENRSGAERANPANNATPSANTPANPNQAANQPPQPPRFIAEDKVPATAKTLDVVNTPIAETFVTKGKPSSIPAITGKGFEVKLLTHPNELYVGETLKAQVLVEGKPVPNLEVDVFKGANSYDRNAKREQPHVKTNANGELEVKFEQSGIYLITTAYPEPNPDATKAPATQTYTYGLTVEVAE